MHQSAVLIVLLLWAGAVVGTCLIVRDLLEGLTKRGLPESEPQLIFFARPQHFPLELCADESYTRPITTELTVLS